MTPLNCIIGNSKIVLKRLKNQLDNFQRAMNEKNGCYNYQGADMARQQSITSLISGIQQSGEIMHFYNDNQVQRLKINRGAFTPIATFHQQPEKFIREVVAPFEPEIQQKNLNVFFAQKNAFNFELKLDWRMYQLIIFNIIQNAIKYNIFQGDILILITCKPRDQSFKEEQSQNPSR